MLRFSAGSQVTTEVAPICALLADEFPDKKLSIPLGDPRRGPYLTWLVFILAGSSRP